MEGTWRRGKRREAESRAISHNNQSTDLDERKKRNICQTSKFSNLLVPFGGFFIKYREKLRNLKLFPFVIIDLKFTSTEAETFI